MNLLILAISIIPIEYAIFTNIFGKILQYSFLTLFFGVSIPILILANIKLKFINKSRKEQYKSFENIESIPNS